MSVGGGGAGLLGCGGVVNRVGGGRVLYLLPHAGRIGIGIRGAGVVVGSTGG